MNKRSEIICTSVVVAWFLVATVVTMSAIKERMPIGIWRDSWEFVKFIIGPAIGAGMAFYVNDYVHKQRKKNDERILIYGATFAITSMLGDFLNLKVVVRDMLADAAENMARKNIVGAPLVDYAWPHVITFVEKNGVDLASLHFLLPLREGQVAFQQLQHLERCYKHLISTHEGLNEALLERQTKMSAAHAEYAATPDESKIEKEIEIVGLKTLVAARDYLVGLVEHVQLDEQIYIDATNALAAAADIYLKEATPLKHRGYPDAPHLEANLRPLPRPFEAALEKRKP